MHHLSYAMQKYNSFVCKLRMIKKNLQDIREFTSPEVFAEIQMQLQERGNSENKTDDDFIRCRVTGCGRRSATRGWYRNANHGCKCVRFNGLIQEDRNNPAAPVSEIWHFRKELASMRWTVAGVAARVVRLKRDCCLSLSLSLFL